ncbi:hypothetical protein HYZ76_02490 [Candidatus Falkowbacteria bacterium]|nr:hypothetical protein [Candidatus Falkowbacteria bacterium]
MSTQTKLIISIILIALGVAARLLPHLWNFAPIAAIALFAGVYLGRRYAIILPVAAMALGDLLLGFYSLPLMLAVYGSFILIGLLGTLVKKHKSFETVVAGSLAGSVLFFVITNWTVWQFSPWYAKDLAGFISCFAQALPFFRNTLLGDMFYLAVLFGSYEMLLVLGKNKRFLSGYFKKLAKIS